MNRNYHVTADSFGADLPGNWEEIADYLNNLIDTTLENMDGAFEPGHDNTGLSADGHEALYDIWERYCAGEIEGAPAPM